MSAAIEALPLVIIYKATSKDVYANWVEGIDMRHQIFPTTSPSGWTNNDIGLSWLEHVFQRYTKIVAQN